MPIPVELNIAIRNRVRRPLVLPSPAPPFLDPDLTKDTTDEAKKALQTARIFPSDNEASRAALAAAAAAERAAAALARGAGRIISPDTVTIISGTVQGGVAGPISFPYTITEAHYTGGITPAGAVFAGTGWTVLISTNQSLALADIQADMNIIDESEATILGVKVMTAILVQGTTTVLTRQVNKQIDFYPSFIKAFTNVPIGTIQPGINVTITEAPVLTQPGIAFAPTFGRINLNVNTAPPPTRTARASTPRAAEISITQGGRVLSSRIIAWESLTPALRADWFNRQVGGTADPNIRWIP